MSKGSQRVTFRLNAQLIEKVDAAILDANLFRAAAPYDRSGWIKQAIREKLAKLRRGRAPRRRGCRTTTPAESSDTPDSDQVGPDQVLDGPPRHSSEG